MPTVSTFALRIPASLMEDVKALATRDAVSVNQFLVQVVAEKVATLKARGHLAEPVTITKNGRDRRAVLPEELTEEDIAAIAVSEMDPRHDHLNEEVRGWQP